jgi:hypothetical protein
MIKITSAARTLSPPDRRGDRRAKAETGFRALPGFVMEFRLFSWLLTFLWVRAELGRRQAGVTYAHQQSENVSAC